MDTLNYGNGSYSELLTQLELVGNKSSPGSSSGMMYSWMNPATKKIYNRTTSNSLEISIMTESKYHDLFDIRACVTKENTGVDYYGSRRDSEIAIRVKIDTDRIHLFREKSDSLRAYLSKIFE